MQHTFTGLASAAIDWISAGVGSWAETGAINAAHPITMPQSTGFRCNGLFVLLSLRINDP
jgi:hypothetical protein